MRKQDKELKKQQKALEKQQKALEKKQAKFAASIAVPVNLDEAIANLERSSERFAKVVKKEGPPPVFQKVKHSHGVFQDPAPSMEKAQFADEPSWAIGDHITVGVFGDFDQEGEEAVMLTGSDTNGKKI
jgi:hypothetical protein